MWCQQRSWGSTVLRGEPFFHMVAAVDRVGLSLRRANDSSGTCLMSTVINEGLYFICEIAGKLNQRKNEPIDIYLGESGRTDNASTNTIATQSSRTTTARTSGSFVLTLSPSNPSVQQTTAIGSSTTSSDKRWFWMLLGTAAASLMIISTLILIIVCQCSQRTSETSKATSKVNTSRRDPDDADTISNISTDSAVTGVTNDVASQRKFK